MTSLGTKLHIIIVRGEYGALAINGCEQHAVVVLHKECIIACAKHIPLHGIMLLEVGSEILGTLELNKSCSLLLNAKAIA